MKKLYILLFFIISYLSVAAQSDVFFDMFYDGNCAPLTVSFSNNTIIEPGDTIGPVIYKWFINGEIVHEGFDLPDSSFQSGWYNVRLEVADLGGPFWRDYWMDFEVRGFDKFITMPENPCPNEMIQFYIPAQSDWIVWKFPNGDIINQHDAFYTFDTPGVYEVKVTGSTECGVDSIIQNIDISDTAIPNAEIWTDGDWFCPNDEIKFESPEATSYEWEIDGTILNERVAFYAFGDTGQYLVNLTTTNTCGNTNSTTKTIYIQDTPDVNNWFHINPEFGCPGSQVEFEATGSGSFFWDLGDGSVAYDRVVTNTYMNEGTYFVNLTVTNGCGYSASFERPVDIYTDPNNIPSAHIRFDEFDDWVDTLKVCPNSEVRIMNDSWGDDLEFTWDINGTIFNARDLIYPFTNPGLNTIMMVAHNRCGGNDTTYKYVVVTDTLKPMSMLSFAPMEMCPNEFAYFWDDGGHDDYWWRMEQGLLRQQLVYDLDFGDGTFMNGITEPTVIDPEVLAKHQYAAGTWDFIFTAKNSCNNYDTLQGQIIVDDNPDRVPFYYVENSTSEREDEEMEDWSIPVPDAHEFLIGVDLFEWSYWGPQDSTIFVYFWYGEIDPNGDPGSPNGFVELTGSGTVTAYIPFNNFMQSIGIASIWSCNTEDNDPDPQVYALPMDTTFAMVQSFPIEPDGFTDLTTLPLLTGNMLMDMTMWDGICPASENIQNKWFYQSNEGYMVTLGIWEDDTQNLVYQISYGADIYDNYQNIVSNGNIYILNDTLMDLQAEAGDSCSPETTTYFYLLSNNGNNLEFISASDLCTERQNKLLGGIFEKESNDYDMDRDRSGCPGDDIKFSIIGGESYEWHFEDASTSFDPITFYAYADTGTYTEYVVATNTCGRIDTIYTTVRIDTTNLPWANWSPDKWNIRRFEEIQFFVHDDDDTGNNIYFWEFGDNTSSTLRDPIHMFTTEGDYSITLTVTNGCGSSSQTMNIYVMRETVECQAKFNYDATDLSVSFLNNSVGDNLRYVWEFGDGTMSEQQNPVHEYPHDGMFEVRLMIQDTIDFCSDDVFFMVQVGIVDCFTDFIYTVNNTNNSVIFNDQSMGTNSWFWEFGDGNFSTEQNPSHTYMYPGVYLVCLSSQDEAGTGCMSQICKEIVVGSPNIIAEFNYAISQQDRVVQFFDDSEGDITHWYWEFGDGTYDTVPDPEHFYTNPGYYPVCLSVQNHEIGTFDYRCKDIIITGDTSVTMTKADFSFFVDPATNEVIFTDESMGATNWYWMFGDGSFAETQNTSNIYAAPGIYEICLIVFNSVTGERSDICKTIQVGTLTCNIQAEFEYFIDPQLQTAQFSDASIGVFDSWFWEFGDGTTSTQQNIEHMYTEPGFYLVSLAVRNSVNDCIDYYADFIQVGTADCKSDFDFTITDATNNTVSFDENSIGDIGNYFWYFGDGNISELENPIYSYDVPGMYNVSLTVIDQSGLCMDYLEKEIQIGTIDCNASFEVYVDSLNKTAYFTNSSLGDATNLFWMFGDGTISEENNPTHEYYALGYYDVSLTTFNDVNGCMDHDNKVILIGSPGNDIQADFIYQTDPATKTVTFYNESRGEDLSFAWDFGDGMTSFAEDTSHIYAEGGYQFVCLTAFNSSGMQHTMCDMVKVSDDASTDCLADFIFTVDSTSKTVEFTDISYGNPDTWEWVFDDGITSSEQNPAHAYADTGYYLVGLHTTNSTSGCESRYYELVNVGRGDNGIQASFTYFIDTTSTKFGSKAKPTDIWGQSHGGGSSVSWSYGDKKSETYKEVTASTLRPTHVYTDPGNYKVCLTIEDPIIGQSDTYCDYIMIPFETIASTSICQGDSYNFFGNALTTDGEYIDTTTSINGVDSIVSLTLTVNPIPDKPTVTDVSNTLTSSSASGYQWYKDGVAISGATDQTYTATENGDFHVVVTNTYACSSVASDAVTVSVSGIDQISKMNIELFPNPMQDYTRINYNLTNTAQINITVFDASGNQVTTLINTYKPAGDHEIIWRNPGLSSGVYYLVFKTEKEMVTKKIIIQ